jgi:hypothetical protein
MQSLQLTTIIPLPSKANLLNLQTSQTYKPLKLTNLSNLQTILPSLLYLKLYIHTLKALKNTQEKLTSLKELLIDCKVFA